MLKKICFLSLVLILLTGFISCKPKKDESVEEVIAQFVENYASSYLTTDNLDYHVVVAVKALENSGYDIKLTDYISKSQVESSIDPNSLESVSEMFKTLIIFKSFGIEYSFLKEKFLGLDSVLKYEYASYLIACNILNIDSPLKEEVLSDVNKNNESDFLDPDYAAFALISLVNKNLEKDVLISLITTSIEDEGVVAWGTVNSASTASSIMGLIAIEYDKEVIEKLVKNLLEFNKDGAFYWSKSDSEVDKMFSTPQSFASLVTYKLYLENNYKSVVIYK